MPNLKPFRQYDDHDVINLFSYEGASATKGTFVKIVSGWQSQDVLEGLHGEPGAFYGNTVSTRYKTSATITPCTSTGDKTIGMLLYTVAETDENGEKLIFNPRKAAEMQISLSGQAVPIATRGLFLYSGISGDPVVGNPVYIANDGGLTCTGNRVVGQFLGLKETDGYTLIHLDINSTATLV